MNKRLFLAATVAAAITSGAHAQINSPSGSGYLLRAEQMLSDENFNGCLDQVTKATALPLTPSEMEKAAFIKATASVHTDKVQAIALLNDFLDRYAASLLSNDALLALGDCYYGSDYDIALRIYRNINPAYLNEDKADELRYRSAYCYLKKEDYDNALAIFNQLGSSKQFANAALFYRGYIDYAKGDFTSALKLLKEARSNYAPGNMADFYISQIDYANKDYQQALNSAKSLMKRPDIDSEYLGEALRIAGESAYYLNDYDDAEKYLHEYIKITADPEPSALYILGLFSYNIGDYDIAVQRFTPATSLGDAMSQSAYLYIGQALLKQGDDDGAILAFDKALKMNFDPQVQETAYFNYAVASLQGAKVPFGNALSTFENFLKQYPNSEYAPEAQKYVIAAYLNNRNYAQALNSINAMSKPSDDTRRAKQKVLYVLGAQQLANGFEQEAISYLKEAKGLSNYDAKIDKEVSLLLGEAYYRIGNYDASASELQSYVKGGSRQNKAIGYFDLGYTRFAQEKYADAAANFQKMIDCAADIDDKILADAYTRLGDSQYQTHNFAHASEAYGKAIQLNPKVGDYAMLQMAMMEGFQRNHAKKISILKDLQSKFPSSALIPDALLEMTESYIQLGENHNAINTYKQLVAEFPNTSQGRQGYLQMALTMLNAGQKANAIDAYKDVITLFPSSDEASQAAEQLKRIYAADGAINEFMAFINNVPNAPRMDESEADNIAFEVAEKDYLTDKKTSLLETYLKQYPKGASKAKALAYLMESCSEKGNSKKAYEYACALLEDYPDNALATDALNIKGETEMRQGKHALALRTFKDLEQKASLPTDKDYARLNIAICALECGQNDEAINAADAVLASSSTSSADRTRAHFIIGMAQDNFGNTDEARSNWKEAAKNLSDLYGIQSAYYIAESYYKTDDLKKAESLAKNVTDADTPHTYWMARGFILLSDIYTKQGNTFKAQQYLQSLRDNYPGKEPDIFKMIDQRIKN